MKTIKDFLTGEEIVKYEEGWQSFGGKYKREIPYHVHSGKPVISKVFRFEDKPVFRSRIISKQKLRSLDPYFISKAEYIFPFWHITHYFIVLEQMYHASMRYIRNTDKFKTYEVSQEFKLSNFIFWHDDISVELIWELRRQAKKYSMENCHCALYDNKDNKVKGRFCVGTFVEQRPHIRSIEKINRGCRGEVEVLVGMIESRSFSQGNLIKPRTNVIVMKEELISALRAGKMPERKLYNFFSFWDRQQ